MKLPFGENPLGWKPEDGPRFVVCVGSYDDCTPDCRGVLDRTIGLSVTRHFQGRKSEEKAQAIADKLNAGDPETWQQHIHGEEPPAQSGGAA